MTALSTMRASAPRRGAAVLALALVAAACGGAEESSTPAAPATTGASTIGASTTSANEMTSSSSSVPSSSSSSAPVPSSSTSQPAEGSGPDGLLAWLGAERLVVRQPDGTVVATTVDSELRLASEFPVVRGLYLFDDGSLLDFAGQPVCPEFELLGDFHVVDDVEITASGQPAVIVEDRRAFTVDLDTGTAPIPRWRYDCATDMVTELDPTTTVAYQSEAIEATTTRPSGLTLVSTRGLGDTPLVLTTGDGTPLLTGDELAYDHVLSADETTIYVTAYASTGASSPPVAVLAIDVATGQQRWRRDLPGFAWPLGDRVLIEVVEWDLEQPWRSPAREVLLVDPATGADLERATFSDRIIALS